MKPQIQTWALDRKGVSPHLQSVAEPDEDRKSDRESREAKLAQALRANLRRRKAGAPAPAKPKPHETRTD